MDKPTIKYIFNYCSRFMTADEAAAWKYYMTGIKFGKGDVKAIKESSREFLLEKKWLSDDPGVLELLKDGNEIFELRTAERIFAEHYEELDLNKCPICGNLARTPTAKQCRYCGHDWH